MYSHTTERLQEKSYILPTSQKLLLNRFLPNLIFGYISWMYSYIHKLND